MGVSRLVADPGGDSVDYAVLVADAYQSPGLGGVLTDYCPEIPWRRGILRVVPEATSDNVWMAALFTNRGFAIHHDEHAGVQVTRDLTPE